MSVHFIRSHVCVVETEITSTTKSLIPVNTSKHPPYERVNMTSVRSKTRILTSCVIPRLLLSGSSWILIVIQNSLTDDEFSVKEGGGGHKRLIPGYATD